MKPWTISPIENTTDLEVGDVFQITLEGGQTRMGVISDITALPDGTGWTLTLWADPAVNETHCPGSGQATQPQRWPLDDPAGWDAWCERCSQLVPIARTDSGDVLGPHLPSPA